MCKRQRLASAEAASDPRARWIVLDDLQKAITAASTVPWSGAELLSGSTAPVEWESVSTRPSVAPDHLWHPDHWQHDLVWVPCAAGAVAIHRFTPQPGGASSADELARLSELAAEEMAGGGGGGDSASNVGGFHGARDLWSRPELHEGALPWLVGSAVQQAAAAESAALQQGLTPTSVDECWFNMLRPGGWNCLHTHAGSTYSAAFFVADGACCDAADPLAGRLAFLPGGPTQARHRRPARTLPSCSFFAASMPPPRTRPTPLAHTLPARCRRQASAADQRAHSLAGRRLDPALEHACLLLDPTPGTCVVFPSFVPHLVLPTPAVEATAAAPLRLSLAFNFGSCDPVMAHVLVLADRDGAVRVKLVLEMVDGNG